MQIIFFICYNKLNCSTKLIMNIHMSNLMSIVKIPVKVTVILLLEELLGFLAITVELN